MAAPRKSPSRPNNEDTVASSSAPSAKKQRTVAPESPQSVATVRKPIAALPDNYSPETPPSEFCLHDVDEDDHASLAPPRRRRANGLRLHAGLHPAPQEPAALCATLIILTGRRVASPPLPPRRVSPAHTDEVLMRRCHELLVNPASLRPPRAWTWPMVPPYPTLNVDPVLTSSLVLLSVQDECDLSPVSRVWSQPAAHVFVAFCALRVSAVSDGMPEEIVRAEGRCLETACSAWYRRAHSSSVHFVSPSTGSSLSLA